MSGFFLYEPPRHQLAVPHQEPQTKCTFSYILHSIVRSLKMTICLHGDIPFQLHNIAMRIFFLCFFVVHWWRRMQEIFLFVRASVSNCHGIFSITNNSSHTYHQAWCWWSKVIRCGMDISHSIFPFTCNLRYIYMWCQYYRCMSN